MRDRNVTGTDRSCPICPLSTEWCTKWCGKWCANANWSQSLSESLSGDVTKNAIRYNITLYTDNMIREVGNEPILSTNEGNPGNTIRWLLSWLRFVIFFFFLGGGGHLTWALTRVWSTRMVTALFEALSASVPAFIGDFVIVDCRFDYAGCKIGTTGNETTSVSIVF